MSLSLAKRRRRPEWMDQPDLDPAAHEQALSGLARINSLSLSGAVFWPFLRDLASSLKQPVRVLDLASGGGDVVLRLASRAARSGLAVTIDACDRSATAVDHARRRAAACGADAHFFGCDVLHDPLPTGYDVVINSLFVHHLDGEEAVEFLHRAGSAARRLLLVSDLVRDRMGLLLAFAATRLLTRSPIVHVDGPISVEGAFLPGELRGLAKRAGLVTASVRRHWPCHMLLTWRRP